MKTEHRIIISDARCMDAVPDGTVHLVVTSPPYWQLKDYGHGPQIGFSDSYEAYINHLNLVWYECYRVLAQGCRMCINVGDQFARAAYYGRYKVIPIRTEIIKFCETIGFDYMGAIIWQKRTTTNTTGGAVIMGSYPHPRNGILKLDYEFILIFRKGGQPPKVSEERKASSKLSPQEWNTYFTGHWQFPGEKQAKQLAMFPLELPTRLIKMFSFVGETVLDPFLGSGTTALSAKNLKRNSIGYESNPEALPRIKLKLGIDQGGLFEDAQYTFEQPETPQTDYHNRINALPYVFRDPVQIDKTIDPRQHTFGSNIDGSEPEDMPEYYTVQAVLSPECIALRHGPVVKLMGVKTKPAKQSDAVQFLESKTNGQQVFLRYDREKYDDENTLMGYVYLKNKTFINAHLIKAGLADVDTDRDYKYQERFLKYKEG